MAKVHLETPLTREAVLRLQAGDEVFISGTIYVARDAAHKRLLELLDQNREFPVDLTNQIVFYAGPTPPKPRQIIGSIAPTTASRMDPYTPAMYKYGVKGTIGKGPRSKEVKEACMKDVAVCFSAIGGLSALLAQRVKSAEIIAYEDLGPEAIRKLTVEKFPVLVVYDAHGGDLYEQEIAKYRTLD
ncbi:MULTISPECIES: FumA C-terminus/TtdB family hydratase beta subunit [unclassified Paenibacillus]|uniref:FumA C-terminus/TtdB family hydratase beta subunit n=1 Tax=unclassified Paenibacillus TaxID=185978 RepID=UPI001AE4A07B|nr:MULTISPECIES: FumA C-terminus/TtdB family hydratase beta subunit [unclassified Paenibacillus]MBP1154164.1 fumarate hydratase subunit beta [Paenibacillus sp. PvP091]MBP1170451.1 fumarate hydratase subunit beta [Paenibacillus sp. PvR098]MBP2441479.1 fumarate hydratase subunit beta [Paenibacillus sp. PvP052]